MSVLRPPHEEDDQTMGFFERLAEVAGAEAVDARLLQHSWTHDPCTLLELNWRTPL